MKIHHPQGGNNPSSQVTYGKTSKLNQNVSKVAQAHMPHQPLKATNLKQKAFEEYVITYPVSSNQKMSG